MLRCSRLLESASATAVTHEVHLAFDERVKSRLAAICSDGTAVAIVLPRATVMRDGTLLATDDGAVVRVVAATQPVVRITAATPIALLRAVYHLANRHVAAQLAADHVLIEPDPVLERLLQALDVQLERLQMPFDPEPGAYDGHGGHGSHGHGAPSDDASAGLGEQLSIEAHRDRLAALAPTEGTRRG